MSDPLDLILSEADSVEDSIFQFQEQGTRINKKRSELIETTRAIIASVDDASTVFSSSTLFVEDAREERNSDIHQQVDARSNIHPEQSSLEEDFAEMDRMQEDLQKRIAFLLKDLQPDGDLDSLRRRCEENPKLDSAVRTSLEEVLSEEDIKDTALVETLKDESERSNKSTGEILELMHQAVEKHEKSKQTERTEREASEARSETIPAMTLSSSHAVDQDIRTDAEVETLTPEPPPPPPSRKKKKKKKKRKKSSPGSRSSRSLKSSQSSRTEASSEMAEYLQETDGVKQTSAILPNDTVSEVTSPISTSTPKSSDGETQQFFSFLYPLLYPVAEARSRDEVGSYDQVEAVQSESKILSDDTEVACFEKETYLERQSDKPVRSPREQFINILDESTKQSAKEDSFVRSDPGNSGVQAIYDDSDTDDEVTVQDTLVLLSSVMVGDFEDNETDDNEADKEEEGDENDVVGEHSAADAKAVVFNEEVNAVAATESQNHDNVSDFVNECTQIREKNSWQEQRTQATESPASDEECCFNASSIPGHSLRKRDDYPTREAHVARVDEENTLDTSEELAFQYSSSVQDSEDGKGDVYFVNQASSLKPPNIPVEELYVSQVHSSGGKKVGYLDVSVDSSPENDLKSNGQKSLCKPRNVMFDSDLQSKTIQDILNDLKSELRKDVMSIEETLNPALSDEQKERNMKSMMLASSKASREINLLSQEHNDLLVASAELEGKGLYYALHQVASTGEDENAEDASIDNVRMLGKSEEENSDEGPMDEIEGNRPTNQKRSKCMEGESADSEQLRETDFGNSYSGNSSLDTTLRERKDEKNIPEQVLLKEIDTSFDKSGLSMPLSISPIARKTHQKKTEIKGRRLQKIREQRNEGIGQHREQNQQAIVDSPSDEERSVHLILKTKNEEECPEYVPSLERALRNWTDLKEQKQRLYTVPLPSPIEVTMRSKQEEIGRMRWDRNRQSEPPAPSPRTFQDTRRSMVAETVAESLLADISDVTRRRQERQEEIKRKRLAQIQKLDLKKFCMDEDPSFEEDRMKEVQNRDIVDDTDNVIMDEQGNIEDSIPLGLDKECMKGDDDSVSAGSDDNSELPNDSPAYRLALIQTESGLKWIQEDKEGILEGSELWNPSTPRVVRKVAVTQDIFSTKNEFHDHLCDLQEEVF